MKNISRILSTPSCWIRNHPTNEEWDKTLNEALDTCEIIPINKWIVLIGNLRVWIGNYPYCFGCHGNGKLFNFDMVEKLPSRKTAFKLYDRLHQFRLYDQLQQLSKNSYKESP